MTVRVTGAVTSLTTSKQCFEDTAEKLVHICTHGGCDSTHKTGTSSAQTKFQYKAWEVGTKSQPWLRAIGT